MSINLTCLICIVISSCSKLDRQDGNWSSDKYRLKGEKNFLSGYEPHTTGKLINVVVEIPTGTIEKWEVDKSNGEMIWTLENNKPRIVDYIGYPGNYGMIPKTLLSEELGGDGDPLDVIVLGPPVVRGGVIEAKVIGVLKLNDGGDQDDKIIAVISNGSFRDVNNLNELDLKYSGISDILRIWFTNYKDKMEFLGFGDEAEANRLVNLSAASFLKK